MVILLEPDALPPPRFFAPDSRPIGRLHTLGSLSGYGGSVRQLSGVRRLSSASGRAVIAAALIGAASGCALEIIDSGVTGDPLVALPDALIGLQ